MTRRQIQAEMQNLCIRKAQCEAKADSLRELIDLLRAQRKANEMEWKELVKQIGQLATKNSDRG